MNSHVFFSNVFLILIVFLLVCNDGKASKNQYVAEDEKIIQLTSTQVITDVRQADWEYYSMKKGKYETGSMYQQREVTDTIESKSNYKKVIEEKSWNPIHVGRRWDVMGYPELNDADTWLRLKFFVPKELKDYQFGFFCTAVDDAAHFFLNGNYVNQKKYVIGARIHEPVDINLTPHIQFGEENLLVIRVSDFAPARGGGILGNVLLYRTLPYTRTEKGGISITGDFSNNYSVVLHLGDAIMSKGDKITFSAKELQEIEVPPYILRDDELVIVLPHDEIKQSKPDYLVDLNNVSLTSSQDILSLSCEVFPKQVGLYDLMTFPLSLKGTYNNPFDPQDINVQAVFTTPSGATESISAFFQQDFDAIAIGDEEEILLPKAGNPWKLYYRPRETGKYKFHFLAQDRNKMIRTEDQEFEVVKSNNKGFLRVSKDDPRFFEFDNGESYFGIGPSGWARDTNYIFGGNPRWISTRLLDEYYKRKSEAGSNYDYLLAEFFGRLYIEGGYIDQHVAWKCEHRIRTLEKLGIYWVTCYDDLCRSTVYGLNTLPYSEAQGGPCKSIEELYYKEKSLEMQREHLRCFVSRVSDSPAILVWAIGDEGQSGSAFSRPMVKAWIKGLHEYTRTIDVYKHPHAIGEGPLSPVNGGETIIIPDWYFNPGLTDDGVELVMEIMKKYDKFNVPLINPEGGMVQWTKPEDEYGPKRAGYYLSGERWKFPEAISFHNNLWINLFMKNAVGGTEWLGHFIVQKDQLYHATAMRNFLQGESLTKPKWEIITPNVSHLNLRGFCLQSEGQSWAWVQNKDYTWVKAGHYGKTPPVISKAIIEIPVKINGNYRIELWDTHKGTIASTFSASSKNGMVSCDLPPVEKDIAIKAKLVK